MSADESRLTQLIAAEERALEMLRQIEAAGFVAPGRRESEVDADIAALAEREFGVSRHWHKRLVRTGLNTLCVFSDNPEERTVGDNDTVYLDLGPVFEEWEADIGQTYAVGADPARHALVAALPQVFETTRAYANANPDVTGAALYDVACAAAEQRGSFSAAKLPATRWANFRTSPGPANASTRASIQKTPGASATPTISAANASGSLRPTS